MCSTAVRCYQQLLLIVLLLKPADASTSSSRSTAGSPARLLAADSRDSDISEVKPAWWSFNTQ